MSLQHDPRAVFHPRRGGFANEHVASLVDLGLQVQALPEVDQESADPIVVTGGPRHLGDVVEVPPDVLRRHGWQGVLQGSAAGDRSSKSGVGGRCLARGGGRRLLGPRSTTRDQQEHQSEKRKPR